MPNEFTNYCSHYYELINSHLKQLEHLNELLDNAPYYNGETNLSDIDAIIAYYRNAQEVKARIDETFDEMKKTERTILMIMRHFSIPPGTILRGEIPGEVSYDIWANEHDAVYVCKAEDLAPLPDDPNLIVIKLSQGFFGGERKAERKGKR